MCVNESTGSFCFFLGTTGALPEKPVDCQLKMLNCGVFGTQVLPKISTCGHEIFGKDVSSFHLNLLSTLKDRDWNES